MLLKCHDLLSGGEVGTLLLGFQQHRSESQGQTLRLQDVRESPPSYPGPLGLVGRIGSLCQKSTGDSLALESRSFPYLLCTALQGSSRCMVGVLAGRTLTTLSTSVLSVAHWAGGMYQDHCVRKNCFS
ncbi:hypothetical protein MHYP_G00156700 [Metynnis hypsauchen]